MSKMENLLRSAARAAATPADGAPGQPASASDRILALRAELARREAEYKMLEEKYTKLRHDHELTVASRIWRYTAPVRSVGTAIKSLGRAAVGARRLMADNGGGLKGLAAVARRAVEPLQRALGRFGGPQSIPGPVRRQKPDYIASYEKYSDWIRLYDKLDAEQTRRIHKHLHGMRRPRISVLMPVFNTPPAFLEAAIESVRGQLYPDWELCIADDASTDTTTRSLLERYAKLEPRIRLAYRESNGHISAASNTALSLATGEYLVLLDHDDLLAPTALYWIAREINEHPEAAVIYSDEDKIDDKGERIDPYFKPDFNYELFLAHNVVSHLGAYRKDVVLAIGGFRVGFEGSQDYDLAARVIDACGVEAVRHIPRILYHWRKHSESTAKWLRAKPYAHEAAMRALNEHFERRNIRGRVVPSPYAIGASRAVYELPEPAPQVTLIILTRDRVDLLRGCIESIMTKTLYKNFDVLVVDNGSREQATRKYLDALHGRGVRVIHDDRPFNFSALNNLAAQEARGEILGFLNNDMEVITPEWLDELIAYLCQPGVGVVGARLWYPDHTLQHGGIVFVGGVASHAHHGLVKGHIGYFGRAVLAQQFSAVTGACFFMRRELFAELGGFDEQLAVAYNDVDLCLRAGVAGFRTVWCPYAELYHHESASRGYEDAPAKRERLAEEELIMRSRWGEVLSRDPFYSPNLSCVKPDFSLAFPPRV